MYLLRKVLTSQLVSQNSSRLLHTTRVVSVDFRWRRKNKLPEVVRHEPELYDRPDYSFLDGRPTPISQELKERYEDEKRLAEDALKCLGELDYAIKRQDHIKAKEEEEAQYILSRKLQPKGVLYKPKQSKS